MFGECQRRACSLKELHHRCTNIEPDESSETMIHDVNIEEIVKMKMLMMALRECNVTGVRRSQTLSPIELSC